jgi:hypothetical protein
MGTGVEDYPLLPSKELEIFLGSSSTGEKVIFYLLDFPIEKKEYREIIMQNFTRDFVSTGPLSSRRDRSCLSSFARGG